MSKTCYISECYIVWWILLQRSKCANLFTRIFGTHASPVTYWMVFYLLCFVVVVVVLSYFCNLACHWRWSLQSEHTAAYSFHHYSKAIRSEHFTGLTQTDTHTHIQRKCQMLRFFGCHKSLIQSKYRKRFPLIDSIRSQKVAFGLCWCFICVNVNVKVNVVFWCEINVSQCKCFFRNIKELKYPKRSIFIDSFNMETDWNTHVERCNRKVVVISFWLQATDTRTQNENQNEQKHQE